MVAVVRYLKLYLHFHKLTLEREMAYRADFIIWSLVTIGWFTFNMAFYHLLFAQTPTLGGWTKGQVFVLQGFYFLIEFVIWGILYPNFRPLPEDINRGQIDFDLTKPVHPQFLLSCKRFNYNNLTNLILGLGTIGYGLQLSHTFPHPARILTSFLIFLIVVIFLYSAYFTTVCLAFFVERLHNIVYFFPIIRQFAQVPLPAYQGISRFVVTFVIPAGLIAYVPAQSLFTLPSWPLVVTLIIFAFGSFIISRYALALGLRHYSSAGS